MDRYWIRENDEPWREVSKQDFVELERRAGFHNTQGRPNEPATGGFNYIYRPGQPDAWSAHGTIRDPAPREE